MGKHLQTVAAMACMKSLLMIFNVVFLLSGIVILGIGIWMEVKLYAYMEMSTEFSETAPFVLIGIGLLIIFMGSLACCCTVKGQPVLLYIVATEDDSIAVEIRIWLILIFVVYGGFLAIVFVLQLGTGLSIFAYRSKLTAGFDQGLTQGMINYRNYTSPSASDFDLIQETLQCCGNHGPNDWGNLSPPMPIPLSCCIKENCDTSKDEEIYTQGCYEKVVDVLNSNVGIVAGAAIGIAFFPLIGVILSCCLARVINKTKYEQMA